MAAVDFADRWGESEIEDAASSESKPKTTAICKKYIWRQFENFCEARGYALGAETGAPQLGKIMQDWALNMRKTNGEDYKESVVKTMWNGTAKLLLEKYAGEFGLKIDPFKDAEFKAARDARDAKRRELQSRPEKRKLSSAALTRDERAAMQGAWDEDTPDGLQKKFYIVAAIELAWRGGEAVHTKVCHFRKERDGGGKETGRIEYNPAFNPGAGQPGPRDSKWLAPNAADPSVCPVRLFDKLMGKRPAHVTTDRLFLTPNHKWKAERAMGITSKWFINMPVGKNQLSKWTRSTAEKVGLDTHVKKITNHSNRATAVTQLASSGIPEQQLMRLTGLTCADSIQPYLRSQRERHQELIDGMRGSAAAGPVTQAGPAPAEGTTLPSVRPPAEDGALPAARRMERGGEVTGVHGVQQIAHPGIDVNSIPTVQLASSGYRVIKTEGFAEGEAQRLAGEKLGQDAAPLSVAAVPVIIKAEPMSPSVDHDVPMTIEYHEPCGNHRAPTPDGPGSDAEDVKPDISSIAISNGCILRRELEESQQLASLCEVFMPPSPAQLRQAGAQLSDSSDDEGPYDERAARQTIKALRRENAALRVQLESLEAGVRTFLTDDQLLFLRGRASRMCLWTDATVRKALRIRAACGLKGYNLLRQMGMPLPNDGTLSARLKYLKVPANEG